MYHIRFYCVYCSAVDVYARRLTHEALLVRQFEYSSSAPVVAVGGCLNDVTFVHTETGNILCSSVVNPVCESAYRGARELRTMTTASRHAVMALAHYHTAPDTTRTLVCSADRTVAQISFHTPAALALAQDPTLAYSAGACADAVNEGIYQRHTVCVLNTGGLPTSLAVSCDNALFSACAGSEFSLHDALTGATVRRYTAPHNGNTVNITRFANTMPSVFASCSLERTVALWDARVQSPTPVLTINSAEENIVLSFSPDDSRLLISGAANSVWQVSTLTGAFHSEVELPFGDAPRARFYTRAYYGNGGETIVTGASESDLLSVADADTGALIDCVRLAPAAQSGALHVQSLRANPLRRNRAATILITAGAVQSAELFEIDLARGTADAIAEAHDAFRAAVHDGLALARSDLLAQTEIQSQTGSGIPTGSQTGTQIGIPTVPSQSSLSPSSSRSSSSSSNSSRSSAKNKTLAMTDNDNDDDIEDFYECVSAAAAPPAVESPASASTASPVSAPTVFSPNVQRDWQARLARECRPLALAEPPIMPADVLRATESVSAAIAAATAAAADADAGATATGGENVAAASLSELDNACRGVHVLEKLLLQRLVLSTLADTGVPRPTRAEVAAALPLSSPPLRAPELARQSSLLSNAFAAADDVAAEAAAGRRAPGQGLLGVSRSARNALASGAVAAVTPTHEDTAGALPENGRHEMTPASALLDAARCRRVTDEAAAAALAAAAAQATAPDTPAAAAAAATALLAAPAETTVARNALAPQRMLAPCDVVFVTGDDMLVTGHGIVLAAVWPLLARALDAVADDDAPHASPAPTAPAMSDTETVAQARPQTQTAHSPLPTLREALVSQGDALRSFPGFDGGRARARAALAAHPLAAHPAGSVAGARLENRLVQQLRWLARLGATRIDSKTRPHARVNSAQQWPQVRVATLDVVTAMRFTSGLTVIVAPAAPQPWLSMATVFRVVNFAYARSIRFDRSELHMPVGTEPLSRAATTAEDFPQDKFSTAWVALTNGAHASAARADLARTGYGGEYGNDGGNGGNGDKCSLQAARNAQVRALRRARALFRSAHCDGTPGDDVIAENEIDRTGLPDTADLAASPEMATADAISAAQSHLKTSFDAQIRNMCSAAAEEDAASARIRPDARAPQRCTASANTDTAASAGADDADVCHCSACYAQWVNAPASSASHPSRAVAVGDDEDGATKSAATGAEKSADTETEVWTLPATPSVLALRHALSPQHIFRRYKPGRSRAARRKSYSLHTVLSWDAAADAATVWGHETENARKLLTTAAPAVRDMCMMGNVMLAWTAVSALTALYSETLALASLALSAVGERGVTAAVSDPFALQAHGYAAGLLPQLRAALVAVLERARQLAALPVAADADPVQLLAPGYFDALITTAIPTDFF